MIENIKSQLHEEFQNCLTNSGELSPYYEGMNIFVTKLFQEQLKEILELLRKEDSAYTKSFELYLDTVIINMHTKEPATINKKGIIKYVWSYQR